MKIVAITAEYNPLHIGHLRLISEAQGLQPDLLVVILNGSVMQRGELPLFDKYTRAGQAIKAGADLVLELPQIFGASCAERFADAAVKLLAGIKAEEKILAFGSEEGDLTKLENAAKLLSMEPEEVSGEIRELLDMGCSYPVARAQAFRAYAAAKGIDIADLTLPNNILAIEYLRAIRKRGGVTPFTLPRNGNYHDQSISETAPSASAIRQAIKEGRKEEILSALPPFMAKEIEKARDNHLSPLLLYRLTEISAKGLSRVPDVSEGLENRILRLAKECGDADTLVKETAGKRYTESRVRRILIQALLGVDRILFESEIDAPPYYKVLAIKKECTDALSLLSRSGKLLTGESEAKESGIASAVIDSKAHDIYRIATGASELDNGMIVL